MADEMKLKHDIIWSTQSLEPVGLVGDLIDLKTIIKKIISADDDVPDPTHGIRGSNKDCAKPYATCMTSDSAKSNHEALQSHNIEKRRSKLLNDWEEKCAPKIKNNTAVKKFEA
eukprot:6775082-Ditylum_brightwellii.AAC.1